MDKENTGYQYLEKIKNIEESILRYLESEDSDENFSNTINLIVDLNDLANKYYLKSLLHLISKISNNHFRLVNFIHKIEKIIKTYESKIKEQFSNIQIYHIFKKNKRILLFLFEEKILIPDKFIAKEIKKRYGNYFYNEFKSFIDDCEYVEILEENRKIGENDQYICQLIRNDSVKYFIKYVSKTNLSLTIKIKPSIYETNPFLLKNLPTLIEYAAFFGSIQIFQYLQLNGVNLDSSLWLYAIHGNNPDIIHILEYNDIEPKDTTFVNCLNESIKCHHLNISYYLEDKYLINSDAKMNNRILFQSVKSCNFIKIFEKVNEKSISLFNLLNIEYELKKQLYISLFNKLCKYGYFILVDFLVKNTDIYINFISTEGTPLIIAIQNDDIDLIKLLLAKSDVDANLTYNGNLTPLSIATYENKTEIVNLLLKNEKIDVNKKSSFHYYGGEIKDTPLITAVKYNYIDIVKLLLKYKNINVNEVSVIQKSYYEKEEKETALMIAIKNKNIEIVKLLLENKNIDINYKMLIKNRKYSFKEEIPTLNMAIASENIEITKLLLSNKNIKNSQPDGKNIGKTPLNFAIERNNIEIVKLLLENPSIDPNAKSIKDYYIEETALMIAIKNNNIEIIKLLLNHPNIDINPQPTDNKYGDTALNIALRDKKYDIAHLLLSKPNINVNSKTIYERRKETSLSIAVKNNDIEFVKILLSKPDIDVNSKTINDNEEKSIKEETPLSDVNKKDSSEYLKILFSFQYYDDNSKVSDEEDKELKLKRYIFHNRNESYHERTGEETALMIAIKNNNIEIIKLLLNHPNIDINPQPTDNKYGDTALNIALRDKKYEIAHLLLSKPNINVNSKTIYERRKETSLSIAVKNNDIEFVKILLSKPDIDVNSKIENLDIKSKTKNLWIIETPLTIAFQNKNNEIIKLLLNNPNIDINSIKYFSNDHVHQEETTALNMAVELENVDFVKILLSNESIKFYKPKFQHIGKTALNIAVEKGNIEIINLFLNNPNIDVNAKSRFINEYNNFEEETALMIAIKNNNIEIVKILIDRPDININPQPNKFHDGDTALNIAIRNHNIEIIKLLLSKPNIGINSQTIYHKTNEPSVSSLYLAIKQNNLEIIQLLLSYPNIDVNCFTVHIENWNRLKIHKEKAPIHLAAEKNNIEMMKLLLSHPKIDTNAKSYCYYPTTSCWQNTALRIAIENKNLNMIKLLLENPRTNVNIKSCYGYIHNKIIDISNAHSSINQYEYTEFKTPLFDAVEYGNVEITQLLMKKADIDIHCKSDFIEKRNNLAYKDIDGVIYYMCKKKISIFDIIDSCNPEIKYLLKNKIANKSKC